MPDNFHDFNSFQRYLKNQNIDGRIAVVLTEMYVQQLDMAKQLDMCAKVISELVDTVQNFANLHDVTTNRLRDLNEHVRGKDMGVSVHSESTMTDPDDYKN